MPQQHYYIFKSEAKSYNNLLDIAFLHDTIEVLSEQNSSSSPDQCVKTYCIKINTGKSIISIPGKVIN